MVTAGNDLYFETAEVLALVKNLTRQKLNYRVRAGDVHPDLNLSGCWLFAAADVDKLETIYKKESK